LVRGAVCFVAQKKQDGFEKHWVIMMLAGVPTLRFGNRLLIQMGAMIHMG
jgi:hypothetical protein